MQATTAAMAGLANLNELSAHQQYLTDTNLLALLEVWIRKRFL